MNDAVQAGLSRVTRRQLLAVTGCALTPLLPGTAASQQTKAAGVFEELLGLVPQSIDTNWPVTMHNFALGRTLVGAAAPDDQGNVAQKLKFLERFPGRLDALYPSFLSGLGKRYAKSNHERYLGILRVDADISVGAPPNRREAIMGLMDSVAGSRQRRNCADCSEARQGMAGAIPYLAWGGDFETNVSRAFRPPTYDELGRGGRFIVSSRTVQHALSDAAISEMATAREAKTSMLQNEDFVLASRAADSAKVYALYATTRTQTAVDADVAAAGPRLAPYNLLAVGPGEEPSGASFNLVALVHASEQLARENVELLPARIGSTSSLLSARTWASQFSEVTVQQRGRLLVAILKGNRVAPDFVINKDPLLLHR